MLINTKARKVEKVEQKLKELERELAKLKEELKEENNSKYPVYCTNMGAHLLVKFTDKHTGTVLESHSKSWKVGLEYDIPASHLETEVWKEIAYDEERGLYDKQVVWCWNDSKFGKSIRFYNAVNKCTFRVASGERMGLEFDNYEAVKPSQIPQFMLDAYDKLED